MEHYAGYLIDLDGTIYQGKTQIPTAQAFMQRLIDSGQPYLFVTNNSTRTPADVAENLQQNHHVPTTAAHVYTTAIATADYLKRQAETNGQALTAYAIGEQGLRTALTNVGFTLVEDSSKTPTFVVVGLDRDVTYEKFVQAVLAIQHGAKFIATNLDTNIPNQRGMLPGAGAVVDFVRYATGIEPLAIGKPSTIIMEEALRKLALSATETVMVGDNLQTDIQAAVNAGMDSLMTLTGLSQPADIERLKIQPTHIVADLIEWQV
ncbi:TIGR01457 family HAD-type hydrolase [Furfurilactobacillus siliginis]|uniref:Acid sugar phosphatase n=1 Tax=Furfurilactobacillus siliginis TaxID=348151 RepID=A0A0R2L169_9LACO|nr:TIGR01457 family HAD-type hydrolase [Furfurilactobacillus siliginis]KRN93589.1 HAD family haloacid dehalogenase hydrolase [Furfurilactobacillus siliginis]GEK29245.1 acid sugar phosphatase [Furfurilactobacillus siliginis]